MDINSATTAAADSSQNAISLSLIKSTENIAAVQVSILMGSLGIGNNVNTFA